MNPTDIRATALANEDQMRAEAIEQRQRNTEAAINAAISLYIAAITAPWVALADLIRSETR